MEGNHEKDSSPFGKFPSAVTMLYHAHNSNVFKSSESSVQITSAVNGHAHAGSSKTSQNFCELDIVSRREKEKSGDGRSSSVTTDDLKNAQPNTSTKGGVFRKKLYDRHIKENNSGILCLANVVKDVDEDYCKPIISKTKEREERAKPPLTNTAGDHSDPKQKQLNDFLKCKEYSDGKKKAREDGRGEIDSRVYYVDPHKLKKSRSVSRRRRAKERSPTSKSVDQKPPKQVLNDTRTDPHESLDDQSFDPLTETSKKVKFVDLAQARAMYFVELPNQSVLKKKAKSKYKKDSDSVNSPNVIEREDPKLGHIIINKIDGEYPTASSFDTETSIPIKLKSEISFDSLAAMRKKQKKHNNSPQPEDSSRAPKTSKEPPKAREKHKKKHRTSPRGSYVNVAATNQMRHDPVNMNMNYDFVPCKEERKPEKEVEILYKKKVQRRSSAGNMARSPSKRNETERKSNKHSSKSPVKEAKVHEKKDKSPVKDKTAKEKIKKEKPPKLEKKDDKKRRPSTATARRVHSTNRDSKLEDKREISPKNLKMKDPSHSTNRKISPVHGKSYEHQKFDTQKFRRGLSPDNQTKREPVESGKKRKDNAQPNFRRSFEPKEYKEVKQLKSEHRSFSQDSRSYARDMKTISYQPKLRLTETAHSPTSKKLRNENEEERKHLSIKTPCETVDVKFPPTQQIKIDTKDIHNYETDDNAVVSIFVTNNALKSESRLVAPEREIKNQFANLFCNKNRLIGEKAYQKIGKHKLTLKTASSNEWSASMRKKSAKKKQRSKPNIGKIKRNLSKCKELIEINDVDGRTRPIGEPFVMNAEGAHPIPEEKAMQTSMQPLITKSQCVGVGMPVNHYMGYFVPPQVAERFSRKYSTLHSVKPELLKSSEKPQQSIVTSFHPKIKRSRSCVPTKFNDTVIDDPGALSPSKSQVLSSKRSSATQLNMKNPRKMRSKSVVTKEDHAEIDKSTLGTIESREHLRQELKKLNVIQQSDIRKRLKVTSKPIDRNDYDLTTPSPGSDSTKGVTGSNRLKPRLPSKQEQDAILSLPIFQNEAMSSTNSLTSSELSAGIKVNTVLKLQSHFSQNPEEEPCHPEENKKRRKGKQTRREVSFSQLNTKPLPELYLSPRSDKFDLFDALTGDDKKVLSKSTIYSDIMSEPTDASLEYKENERKLQCVHMILGEKVTEICNKAIGNDGKVIEGYTVSGIEPPKKLGYGGRNSVEMKYTRNTDKLHLMFFPPTQVMNYEIQPKESYAYGIFIQPEAVKESNYGADQSDKSTLSGDSMDKSSKKNCKNDYSTRPPVLVKTKRKLLPFESAKKKNKGLTVKKVCDIKKSEGTDTGKSLCGKIEKTQSSLFLEVSSSDDKLQVNVEPAIEPFCKKQQKKPNTPRQEIRNLSRINSAVKMMESSLQIIKEESQSTDSSAKQVSDKKKKTSITDIKQTQTELVTNDLDKMKEVISYLYMAFDRKEPRTIINCLQDPRDIITKLEIKQDNQLSSTESSSCCEQFKNMVKNVKPKLTTLKRMSKPDISQRHPIVNRCSTSEGRISPSKSTPSQMYLEERPITTAADTCAFICMNLHDSSSTLIPAERLYCSSDTKFFRQVNPGLSPPKKRVSSFEFARPDDVPPYSTTKDLLNTLRTTKSIHAEPEKHDKAICTDPKPEIKSSTSISDFSSVVVSVAEMEGDRLQQEVYQIGQIHTANTLKMSEEKSIQCLLTENDNCKSDSFTLSDRSINKNNKSLPRKLNTTCMAHNENVVNTNILSKGNIVSKKKVFEHKSLQTSAGVADPKLAAQLERALPQIPCGFVYANNIKDQTSTFCNLAQKASLQSFGSHRCVRHRRKLDSGSSQDSLTATKMSVKFYKNKKDQEKSLHLSRHDRSHKSEGRKLHGNKTVEVDYINLLKLERHLEQVLGLYPTVCKAIRAHMANNLGTSSKTPDKYGMKDRKKLFVTSQDTLATTVDTITEYNVMETDDNISKSSQSRGHRHLKFPLNKYLYESRFKFQKPQSTRRNKSRCSVFVSSGKSSSKNLELMEPSTPYPYTDTSSSSSKAREYRMIQYKRDRKTSRWNLRKTKKYKKGSFDFYSGIFSDDVRDNWSIGSPLYSNSTPSLSLSKNDLVGKTKSKSLTTTQIWTSQLSTSKSLIEVSSNKNVNRRAMIHHIKEDLLKSGKNKTFRLGTQQVFVLSLDSTKPLSTSPSKLLAKVEQHLHYDKSDYTTTTKITEISEPKTKIDETNCYSLLFAENGRAKRRDRHNTTVNDHSFYIHNRQSSSSDMDLLDSIEKVQHKAAEDEDLGNFSADSLESTSAPGEDALNYTMELLQNNLMPPKQNFFVYTSTINYGTNSINNHTKNERTTAGSRPGSRPTSRQSSGRDNRKGTYSKPNSSRSSSLNRYLSPSHKNESLLPLQCKDIVNAESNTVPQVGTGARKSNEDSSNTLLSESGYETSNKTKPTGSIKNFFKKGGSLLDIFRHTTKSKTPGQSDAPKESLSSTNLTNFSNLYSKNRDNQADISTAPRDRPSQDDIPTITTTSGAKIFWSNLAKNKHLEKAKITFSGSTHTNPPENQDKATSTTVNKKCCVSSGKSYEKQMCACHEYAEKVVQESQMRKEGYQKQYKDFEEIPLELLIGRKVPFAFRKGPPIVQMKLLPEKGSHVPEPPRYPYYDSDSVLQEKQPFVTFVDDKIVFKSSQTNITNFGYRSKPTSPSRGVQAKPFKQRGSVHDIFCRSKITSTRPRTDDPDNDSESSKGRRRRKKAQNTDGNELRLSRKKSADKGMGIDRIALFRRKRSKSSVRCLCDTEDDDTATVPIETQTQRSEKGEDELQTEAESGYQLSEVEVIKSPRTEQQTTNTDTLPRTISPRRKSCFRRRETQVETGSEFKTKGTEPLVRIEFPCFKKKRTAQTEIEQASKDKATEPVVELQHDRKYLRTKGTHMEDKPWQKTEATEPMSVERISTSVQETQVEGPVGKQTDTKGTGSEMDVMERSTTIPVISPRMERRKSIATSADFAHKKIKQVAKKERIDLRVISSGEFDMQPWEEIKEGQEHHTIRSTRKENVDAVVRETEMEVQAWETSNAGQLTPISPRTIRRRKPTPSSSIQAPAQTPSHPIKMQGELADDEISPRKKKKSFIFATAKRKGKGAETAGQLTNEIEGQPSRPSKSRGASPPQDRRYKDRVGIDNEKSPSAMQSAVYGERLYARSIGRESKGSVMRGQTWATCIDKETEIRDSQMDYESITNQPMQLRSDISGQHLNYDDPSLRALYSKSMEPWRPWAVSATTKESMHSDYVQHPMYRFSACITKYGMEQPQRLSDAHTAFESGRKDTKSDRSELQTLSWDSHKKGLSKVDKGSGSDMFIHSWMHENDEMSRKRNRESPVDYDAPILNARMFGAYRPAVYVDKGSSTSPDVRTNMTRSVCSDDHSTPASHLPHEGSAKGVQEEAWDLSMKDDSGTKEVSYSPRSAHETRPDVADILPEQVQSDASRTVHTQIEHEPVVKSTVYKPDYTMRYIPEAVMMVNKKVSAYLIESEFLAPVEHESPDEQPPIETIFEQRKDTKEAQSPVTSIQPGAAITPRLSPARPDYPLKSILRQDSKYVADKKKQSTPSESEVMQGMTFPSLFKHADQMSQVDGSQHFLETKTKKVRDVKLQTNTSRTTFQTQTTGDIFLLPQEELVEDDEAFALLKRSDISLERTVPLKNVTLVDSLTILHKNYDSSKLLKNVVEDAGNDRPTSVIIVDKPIVHEPIDDDVDVESVTTVPFLDNPDGKNHDNSDLSVELKMDNPSTHSCASFIERVMDEIINSVIDESTIKSADLQALEAESSALIEADFVSFEEHRSSIDEELPHIAREGPKRQTSEDFRKGLTDKEVFDKLLTSFEKEDDIAVRLSKDENFFSEQIKILKTDSEESVLEDALDKQHASSSTYADDSVGEKHRSTHFWEEKMKAMRAKEENPVKTDDIGTCFARGFRPDNIALSGDACFNLNKQDKIKFSKGMLTDEESIIDFSERETPLDYLLALGFMVDEASNALKDDDIRSRLLAAITEARVWINKITTTQGTLLYLVAYKSRPKTMRYFLQLVEAIINRRINNAIKLDGFLRVLEKVEEGEIQMINILGADKFEDEENEEKIVKKQLRQLFITVYKIAEKEAQQKGNELSPQAIVLLRILAAKYRAGLHPHLELIARYIGQDLLNTETQLEAAMIFLSRLDTAEVKLKEFEAYCDIKCEKKKQKQHSGAKQQDASADEDKVEQSDSQQADEKEGQQQVDEGEKDVELTVEHPPEQKEISAQKQEDKSTLAKTDAEKTRS